MNWLDHYVPIWVDGFDVDYRNIAMPVTPRVWWRSYRDMLGSCALMGIYVRIGDGLLLPEGCQTTVEAMEFARRLNHGPWDRRYLLRKEQERERRWRAWVDNYTKAAVRDHLRREWLGHLRSHSITFGDVAGLL